MTQTFTHLVQDAAPQYQHMQQQPATANQVNQVPCIHFFANSLIRRLLPALGQLHSPTSHARGLFFMAESGGVYAWLCPELYCRTNQALLNLQTRQVRNP